MLGANPTVAVQNQVCTFARLLSSSLCILRMASSCPESFRSTGRPCSTHCDTRSNHHNLRTTEKAPKEASLPPKKRIQTTWNCSCCVGLLTIKLFILPREAGVGSIHRPSVKAKAQSPLTCVLWRLPPSGSASASSTQRRSS